MSIPDGISEIARALRQIVMQLDRIIEVLEPQITGITVTPGVPTVSVKLVKKSASRAAVKKAAAGAPIADFVFQDNQDTTCTVQGTDAAGAVVDISGVATISVSSSDTSIVTVDPPIGMTFAMHGVKPSVAGSPVQITVTATWNDGSVGPFTFVLPVDVTGSSATGLVVTPGTPTVRP